MGSGVVGRSLWMVLLGLGGPGALHAQGRLLEGQVVNARTREPVPFATLGVPRRGLGTVADEHGRFVLRLPADLPDSLVVTSVGFRRTAVRPAELAAGPGTVLLPPLDQVLQEIVVRHRPVRPAQLGRTQETGNLVWTGGSSGKSTVDDEWGWELGTVLRPAQPALLEEFRVFLSANTYEQLRFRLNLYTLEAGRPGRPLLTQDIQLTTKPRQRGWLKADLRQYNIVLEAQPVVATIQWLQSEKTAPETKYFSIPVLRQHKQVMVERENSEATWTIHALQPSLYFSVLTE